MKAIVRFMSQDSWQQQYITGCNNVKAILAGMIFIVAVSMVATPLKAQISAFLPMKEAVAAGDATDADGTYRISTINKRITIANGRAYAIDSWVHALVLRIKPNMVTIRNFRQIAPDRFVADDLPLMGKATFVRRSNGSLDVEVAGAMGPARYRLIPVDYVDILEIDDGGDERPEDDDIDPLPKDREYQIYVNVISCDGTALLRKRYRGYFSLSVTVADGSEVRSKNRNFDVRCTRKGPRRQAFDHDENGNGSLSMVVPVGQEGFSNFTIYTTLNDLLGPLDFKNDKSSLLLKAKNLRRDLKVGESVENVERIVSGNAQLMYRVQLKRVR